MDFKQLQSYIACVKYKSLTNASEKLGIAQPTISIHLKNLEDELKTKLIKRSAKSFEVTPKGKEFYTFAQKILKLRDDLVNDWEKRESTNIKLGISSVQYSYIIPEILLEFNKTYTNTYFDIEQKSSQDIIDGVKLGKYELGLVGMKVDDVDLEFQPFCDDEMVIVTTVNEKFSHMKNSKVELSKILEEPIILREQGSASGKTTKGLLEKIGIGIENLQIVANVNSIESIKDLVVGGLGIAIMSERTVRDYVLNGKLLQFKFPKNIGVRTLYIVCQKDSIQKECVSEFIHFLHQFYK